jgi:glycosidase
MFKPLSLVAISVSAVLLGGCQATGTNTEVSVTNDTVNLVGTEHAFASEAIYFLMTDRFVDGDPANNYEDQGGDYPTWEGKLEGPDGKTAYVGYLGGDFQGVLNNADYLAGLGFTAIWMTPIVDNPDQAFAGGETITFGGAFKDGNKTGYHGYWASNFYKEDEHLVSPGLDYESLNQALAQKGLKTILDVVANHGSPSFTMPIDQPKFGELYDINGQLVADHGNVAPEQIDRSNSMHDFFHDFPDIMQLSNLDETNPKVQDYLINSYLHWID